MGLDKPQCPPLVFLDSSHMPSHTCDEREAWVNKVEAEETHPTVICPGCNIAMRLVLLEPAGGSLDTATYRCERCGTETKREFARTVR